MNGEHLNNQSDVRSSKIYSYITSYSITIIPQRHAYRRVYFSALAENVRVL